MLNLAGHRNGTHCRGYLGPPELADRYALERPPTPTIRRQAGGTHQGLAAAAGPAERSWPPRDRTRSARRGGPTSPVRSSHGFRLRIRTRETRGRGPGRQAHHWTDHVKKGAFPRYGAPYGAEADGAKPPQMNAKAGAAGQAAQFTLQGRLRVGRSKMLGRRCPRNAPSAGGGRSAATADRTCRSYLMS